MGRFRPDVRLCVDFLASPSCGKTFLMWFESEIVCWWSWWLRLCTSTSLLVLFLCWVLRSRSNCFMVEARKIGRCSSVLLVLDIMVPLPPLSEFPNKRTKIWKRTLLERKQSLVWFAERGCFSLAKQKNKNGLKSRGIALPNPSWWRLPLTSLFLPLSLLEVLLLLL